jgi:hypothetical protein
MAVKVELSEEIDRPVDVVFRWYAQDHVRNHPRWDPDIELWLDSEAPIGVGTIIRRRNSRSGTPVYGTMEVVEYEPNQAMAVVTHDGPLEMRGRAVFESIGLELTKLTVTADVPTMNDSMHAPIAEGMKRSLRTVKQLIEAET